MSLNKGTTNFSCPECRKTFQGRIGVTRCMDIHANKFKCKKPKCGFHTHSEKVLQTHIKTHATSHPFFCSQCFVRFTLSTSLAIHTKILHNSPRQKFTCNFCKRSFPRKYELTAHISKYHPNKPPPCNRKCSRTFFLSTVKTSNYRTMKVKMTNR